MHMFKKKIQREWIGSYKYTYGEGLPDSMPIVSFKLYVEMGTFGRFIGTIVDGKEGVPEPAEVSGRVSGGSMLFEKKYSHIWIVNDAQEYISLKDSDIPPINYVGEIVDNGQTILGTWNSIEYYRPIDGLMCKFPEIGGEWEVAAKPRTDK